MHTHTHTSVSPDCALGPSQEYFENKCDDMSPMAINDVGYCRSTVMNYPFEVNLQAFELALVNAVQRTGTRLHYKGRKPVPRADTATGYA
jgi:hypothetical protein